MMMKGSADEILWKANPEIKSGMKWSAIKAAQEAECSPQIKEIIVSEKVRMFEEEQRTPTAVTHAKQCAWTKWNDIEPIE